MYEITLNANQKAAIAALKEELKNNKSELQLAVFNIARANSMEPKDFFKLLYQMLISKDSGPRIGPFVIAIGKQKVIRLLEAVI